MYYYAVPKAMQLKEIKQETKRDAEMQAAIKAVETDQWSNPEVQNYKKLKEELSVFNGLVLKRNRIVIPSTLRSKAVDLAGTWRSPGNCEDKATDQRLSVVPRNRQAGRREGQKLSFLSSCINQITTARTPSNDPTS